MDSLVKEYLIAFYERNLLVHGDRPEALRWTPAGQLERYSLMLEVAPTLHGKRVLDYGCGKGDFYGFLKERGIDLDYTGMDINPALIGLATDKHPGCRFQVFDIEDEPLTEDFDFAFLCGVFNNRVEGATDSMKSVVSALFRHCREGLVVTALSSYAPHKDRELNYVSPEDMAGFALGLTPFVTLRHDYRPDDFTVFLCRRPTGEASSHR